MKYGSMRYGSMKYSSMRYGGMKYSSMRYRQYGVWQYEVWQYYVVTRNKECSYNAATVTQPYTHTVIHMYRATHTYNHVHSALQRTGRVKEQRNKKKKRHEYRKMLNLHQPQQLRKYTHIRVRDCMVDMLWLLVALTLDGR